jgi:hypothetical protein
MKAEKMSERAKRQPEQEQQPFFLGLSPGCGPPPPALFMEAPHCLQKLEPGSLGVAQVGQNINNTFPI